MTADEWVEVAELQSTQEEADTRFLLHAWRRLVKLDSNGMYKHSYPRRYNNSLVVCMWLLTALPS